MTNQTPKPSIDTPSFSGKFGWERLGNEEFAVPVIVRTNGIRYCPTKIVELEIIKKYDILPQSLFACIKLTSYYLTAVEAKLLNEINGIHCDYRYGRDFFCTSDVIISAGDIKELSRFLNISKEVFTHDLTKIAPYFGVIRIPINPTSIDGSSMLVPFTTKLYKGQQMRFIPIKLVANYLIGQHIPQGKPNQWDVSYLKMLCIYCDNNLQHFISNDDQLVLLDGLKYISNLGPVIYQDCTQFTGTSK